MSRIGIIGAGSFGCALAIVLSDNGHEVIVWSHKPEEAARLNKTHTLSDKLPDIRLPEDISFTGDMKTAVKNMDMIVMAVPSNAVRQTAVLLKPYYEADTVIVDVSKGIEETTLMTLSEQILDVIGNARVGILSGPSHAEEVSKRISTCVVASSTDKETALFIQKTFINNYFRVYTSPDIRGIELAGALKNVIALAAGMADGIGTGDNTKAALITRGIKEIAALGEAEGGKHETFYGLAGMGDLIVTCASVHSRNRRAGYYIGQGMTAADAMDKVKMVVEGVYSAKAAVSLAKKHNIEVPIINAVYDVLFDDQKASDALKGLMVRRYKAESPLIPW